MARATPRKSRGRLGRAEDLALHADAVTEFFEFVDLDTRGGLLEIFVDNEKKAAIEGGEDGAMAEIVMEDRTLLLRRRGLFHCDLRHAVVAFRFAEPYL